MGEEIKQATIGKILEEEEHGLGLLVCFFFVLESTTNFGKYSSSVQNSLMSKSRHIQTNKFQNYFQFRSAQHQTMSSSSTKTSLTIKKSTYTHQIYMKDRTNFDAEEAKQEYNRFRNAAHHPSTKVFYSLIIFSSIEFLDASITRTMLFPLDQTE